MPLWSHIVQNSWFRFCIAAPLSSWILPFEFLAVLSGLKINVLLPLTRVFLQITEAICLLALLLTVISLLWFACFGFPRNSRVHYSVPEGSEATILIIRWFILWILRGVSISWSINAGVSTVFTVFRSIWHRSVWFHYPVLFRLLEIRQAPLPVSVSGCWAPFRFPKIPVGFLCERSSLFFDPHDYLTWLALLLPPLGDHTFWAKVYRFFSCWSFQSFFRISFLQDHLFLWLQLLSSVFTPTLTLRSLSLLFISNKLNLKFLCSARFILPVTGNRRYSEFLSHPCLYICNSFPFLSTLLLSSIWTCSAGAWLQLCTVCI